MEIWETKTTDSTSGEYYRGAVVKFSSQSDKLEGRLYVTQSNPLYENLVLRKMENKFDLCNFSPRKVESLVFTRLQDSYFMANLMDIFLTFLKKTKCRPLCEKQISCWMQNNLMIGPIKPIQTQFEMPTPSLPSEHMNKKLLEKQFHSKRRGYP